VQFIYITHNKIAMEMADQLMGVTMHEPGCSRLGGGVEEAMAMVMSHAAEKISDVRRLPICAANGARRQTV
jgi:hypothetical protein